MRYKKWCKWIFTKWNKTKLNLHSQDEYETLADKRILATFEKESEFLKTELSSKNEIINKFLNNNTQKNNNDHMEEEIRDTFNSFDSQCACSTGKSEDSSQIWWCKDHQPQLFKKLQKSSPWPSGTCVIVGDSMVNGYDEKRLSKKHGNLKAFHFSGKRIGNINQYIISIIKNLPNCLILNVGTNDATANISKKYYRWFTRTKIQHVGNNLDILKVSETKRDDTFPQSQFLNEGFSTHYRFDWTAKDEGILLYNGTLLQEDTGGL